MIFFKINSYVKMIPRKSIKRLHNICNLDQHGRPITDNLLHTIIRIGIFDIHKINQRPHTIETARNHMCLFLYDHAKTNRFI